MFSVYIVRFFARVPAAWRWSSCPATAVYRVGNISAYNRATRGRLSDSALPHVKPSNIAACMARNTSLIRKLRINLRINHVLHKENINDSANTWKERCSDVFIWSRDMWQIMLQFKAKLFSTPCNLICCRRPARFCPYFRMNLISPITRLNNSSSYDLSLICLVSHNTSVWQTDT